MRKIPGTLLALVIATTPLDLQAAPSLVIGAGQKGGGYYGMAMRLQTVLAERGSSLAVQESMGSQANLQHLDDASSPVNLAISQTDALQLFLTKNPGFLHKFEILESVGKECVFIIAGKDSGIATHEDLQGNGERRIAILAPDSGVAVTYELMSALEPKFRRTKVTYMDTMQAMWQIGAGQESVNAVMLVQRPKVRSPEMQLALRHPEDYRFVEIDDKDLEDRLPDGTAVYRLMDLALVEQSRAGRVTVKTICTEGLLIAAKDKISSRQRSELKQLLSEEWMRIYPTTE